MADQIANAETVETKPAETTAAVAAVETKAPETKAAETVETKAVEVKAPDKAAEPAALDYAKTLAEVKLPEGFTMDEKLAGPAAEMFGKHKLSAEAVSDLANFYAAQIKAGIDGNAAAFASVKESWKTAAAKDLSPEARGIAKAAVSKYFDAKTVEVLEQFGLADHPGFLKGAEKIGRSIANDKLVNGDAGSRGSSDYRKQYPNSEMNP